MTRDSLRVTIDAAPLLVRSAGVKNYLYHWLTSLRGIAPEGALRTLPELADLGPLHHDRSMAGRARTFASLGTLALANYTPLPLFDWLAGGADLFHASNLMRRPPRRPRLTATVYDMTCWLMPELHSAANLRADRSYSELLRRADGLIAISQSARNDAIKVLQLRPERIRVIYPGIAEPFFDPPGAEIDRVKKHHILERPYVLAVGTIEPRKNVEALLKAYAALPPDLKGEFELVLAGPSGWASRETNSLLGSVRYLGYVPEPDLPALMAGATIFAYPSLYEGFGFPVAQAMAAGTAVLTSAVSSLPEITGDDAVLIDPRSPAELTGGLNRLLTSPSLRHELAGRARLRAARFSWQECAAQSWRFFREIVG